MIVKELIEKLQKMDENQEVYITCFNRALKAIRVTNKLIPNGDSYKKITFIE